MCPVERLASSVASLTRCASPPDSVGRRLAQPHVAQPDVHQRLHVAVDGGLVGEEVHGLGDRHVEHVGDVLALELDVQGVAVVAGALAHLARHVHVGQEVHLDLDRAVAGAGLAAPALDVEREPPRQVAAHLGLVRRGEQLADRVEHAGVRRRVRPRRAPDRRLVHVDDLVEVLDAGDPTVLAGRRLRLVDPLHQDGQQDVADQRTTCPSPDTPGDGDEVAERDRHVDVGEVVLPRPLDHQLLQPTRPARLPAPGSTCAPRGTAR